MQFRPLLLVAAAGFGLFGLSSANADVIAQYHFDEINGTSTADSVGTATGTLSGGAAFVSGGISGNAVDLTQPSDLVSMGNNFGLTGTDFSIVFWLKSTATGANYAVSRHAAGSNNGYIIQFGQDVANGLPNKATFIGSQAPHVATSSSTSVNDGEWHQIVAVHDIGVSNRLYVDGAPAEAFSASVSIVANSVPFLVGGYTLSGVPTSGFTGQIDELQIYTEALTDGQINFLFQNPSAVVPEPTTLALLAAGSMLAIRRKR